MIDRHDSRKLRISIWNKLLQGLGVYVVLILLLIGGTVVSKDFWSIDNFLNIVRPVTLLGIVAVGIAFITYGGNYVDLSIPAIMAFSGMVAVGAVPWLGISGIACGIAAGMAIGLINGYIVGYVRLNPIIWTLAMGFMLDGLLRWSTGGNQVYPDDTTRAGELFVALARFEVLQVPVMTIVLVILAATAHLVFKRTWLGGQIQFTGAAYDVAAASGVNVRRVVLYTFLISSFASSLAGVLLTSLSRQGTFTNGQGYNFNGITAVVLGGVALGGGVGSIVGVLGGVLVIGLLGNIMTLNGWGYFEQMIAKGTIFIFVVGAATYFSRKTGNEKV